MTADLSGRRALVTGASSGIGAALAPALAERGATVCVSARRADRLGEVLERCRGHSPDSSSVVADLSDPADVDRLADEAVALLGGVDLLVNNAGMPLRRAVTETAPDVLEHVMNTNFFSAARLTLRLLPRLLEAPRAHVIAISSIAAKLSAPGEAAYDASKAALSAFFEAMAVELYDSDVSVHLVYPGIIDTELFEIPGNDPLPETGVDALPPSAVVDAVLGQLDGGGLEAWVPEFFAEIHAGKVDNIDGFVSGAAEFRRATTGGAP